MKFNTKLILVTLTIVVAGIACKKTTKYNPNKLFIHKLSPACDDTPVTQATEYSKKSGAISPILVFERKNNNSRFLWKPLSLPSPWKPQINEYEKTELVACIKVTKSKASKKKCSIEDKKTGKKFKVVGYESDYTVSIREAKTAKEVGAGKFSTTFDECPRFAYKRSNEKVAKIYPNYSQKFKDIAKKYVLNQESVF